MAGQEKEYGLEEMMGEAESILTHLGRRVDDAAVIIGRSRTSMVKLAEGRVSIVQSWGDFEVSLYLARERRMLVTSFATRDLGQVVERSRRLLERLASLAESEYYAPLPQRSDRVRDDSKYSERVAELVQNPTPLLEDLYSRLVETGMTRAAGMVEASVGETVLATTGGFRGTALKSSVNGYLRVFGERTSGQWSFTGVDYEPRRLEVMVDKAVEYARLNLPLETIQPGRYRLALSPMVLGNFADYLADMSSAMSVDMGFSFLVGKKPGDRIASDHFTLRDTPRNPMLPGGGLFDAEGVETRDKPIVEKGVLATLLHNTKTARRHGVESTGNAGWISPSPFALQVDAGDVGEDSLYKELGSGILVTNNWYTRLQNYLEGQFSTVARDAIVIVREGEPRALVRKMRIADTFPHLFQSIRALTRERYPIEWWEVETPSLLPYAIVEGVQVTSRA